MTSFRRALPGIVIAGVLLVVTAGVVAFATHYLSQDAKPQKKVVEVQLFKPPPPPPPKVEEPPPPPPPEEVKLPEPEPVADAPDVPDLPGPLGLDAEGGAGSDAFGLLGRKGGRDLIGGGDGRFRVYANSVKDALLDYLTSRQDMRAFSYSIVVQVWIREDGQVGRYEIVGSSGNPKLDQTLRLALDDLPKLGEGPPDGMPQPVRLRIQSRA